MSAGAHAVGVATDLGPTTGVVAIPVHGSTCDVVDDGEATSADPDDAFTAVARDAARRAGHPSPERITVRRCPAPALGGAEAAAAAGARLGLQVAREATPTNDLGDDFGCIIESACAALQAMPREPRPDAVAAALSGRAHAVIDRYPPRVVALTAVPWWLVVVSPRLEAPSRGWSHGAVRTVDSRKAIAAARTLTGWLDAWARADGDALRSCGDDRIHDHAVLPRIPGAHPARNAALAAGALCAGLIGGGPAIAALADHESAARPIADAMRAAWAAHRIESTFTLGPVSP